VVMSVVEMQAATGSGGSRIVEVTFGTALGAQVAVALNGIQFQDKALTIKRPKGFNGQLPRLKLSDVSIKDLIASDGLDAKRPIGQESSNSGAKVKLNGIPASMGSQSVFDLLQQFGGPLKSLTLKTKNDASEHEGMGDAEYFDSSSAAEAVKFSPLLGFIEVQLDDSAGTADAAAAKRQRRNRFDPTPAKQQDDDEDETDLGPFEAALRGRGPAANVDALDLGPFESVLPPSRSAATKASPLQQSDAALDDFGPFEAVLPKKGAAPMAAPADADLDDLGPFGAVLQERKASSQTKTADDDFGPFAAAIKGFEKTGGR